MAAHQQQHLDMDASPSPGGDGRRNSLRLSQSPAQTTMAPAMSVPATPTSIKGHSRFSSVSTLASSPPIRASMDSYLSKRPLGQLREHPEEREAEMPEISLQESTISEQFEDFSSFPVQIRTDSTEEPTIDYDWAENLPFEGSEPGISVAKRRRAEKSTPSLISTKISSRFPSLSRKFRSRSEKRSSSITDGLSLHDSFRSRSRASSMRSATTRESSLDVIDRRDLVILPTPRTSYIEEETTEAMAETTDVIPETRLVEREEEDCGNDDNDDDDAAVQRVEHPGLSRTPLLPPVLAYQGAVEEPLQSPLQSPKVADTPVTSPPSPFETPVSPGLPSPPLSARPSVASFHHRSIIPSSQIPAITLGSRDGPVDEWALRLGHENFTIQPEPYLPMESTIDSCRRLKADWEHAERAFGRHLARTRANYSATSKIAKLTEEKWAAINALWQSCHTQALEIATKAASDQCVAGCRQSLNYELELSKQSSLHEPVPKAQIPSHLVGGKFPNFGDAGIVGPMEVVKPVANALSGPKSRKRGFWKFLQDLIPGGLVSGKA